MEKASPNILYKYHFFAAHRIHYLLSRIHFKFFDLSIDVPLYLITSILYDRIIFYSIIYNKNVLKLLYFFLLQNNDSYAKKYHLTVKPLFNTKQTKVKPNKIIPFYQKAVLVCMPRSPL